MNRGFVSGILLLWPQSTTLALAMPCRQVFRRLQAPEKITDVWIVLRINYQHSVIHVPRLLTPRIEYHFFPGVVWVQCRNGTFDWIVEDHRADTDSNIEFKVMSVGKEWFVMSNRLALI